MSQQQQQYNSPDINRLKTFVNVQGGNTQGQRANLFGAGGGQGNDRQSNLIDTTNHGLLDQSHQQSNAIDRDLTFISRQLQEGNMAQAHMSNQQSVTSSVKRKKKKTKKRKQNFTPSVDNNIRFDQDGSPIKIHQQSQSALQNPNRIGHHNSNDYLEDHVLNIPTKNYKLGKGVHSSISSMPAQSNMTYDINKLARRHGQKNDQASMQTGQSVRVTNFKKQSVAQRAKNQIKGIKLISGFEDDYLSASDPDDYVQRVQLKTLGLEAKKQHVLKLWRSCFNMAFGVGAMLSQKEALTTKIRLFGRQLVAQQANQNLRLQEKPAWYVILPDSKFKTFWNITVILLLLYTSTVVPFQVAFVDKDTNFAIFVNYLVDILFGIDIIVNFFSAYETRNMRIEIRIKHIVREYVTGWFALDLLATFPTQIFLTSDQNTGVNKLARLARIPRLYRLFRVLRIFKIFKLFKYNKKFQQWFGYLNLGATATKMLKLALFGLFLIHLFSCFWYLTAKLDDLNDNTWVVRRDLVYASTTILYWESVYWAVQVLTTVGYGDFGAATTVEYIINLIWMLVGVGYYQIFFGQIISVITASTTNASMLDNKLKALEDFSKETKLYEEDEELQNQIRQFLINNYLELYAKIDEEALLAELPLSLREEVLYRQFGGLVETIKVLRDSTDNEFVWAVVQIASKIAFEKDDTIYWAGDFSENIYMIYKGRVSLYAQNGYAFISYGEGDLLGDSDALMDEVRDSKAIAQINSSMYTVKMEQLDELFGQHSEAQEQMMKLAMRKVAKHKKKIEAIEKRYPIFGMIGEVDAQGKIRKDEGRIGASLIMRQGGRRDAEYTEMINFLDDIDQKLNSEELEEDQVAKIHEFLLTRSMANKNEQLVRNGELAREVNLVLNQRMLQGNGRIEDLRALQQDIKNLKNLYNLDTLNSAEQSPLVLNSQQHSAEGQDQPPVNDTNVYQPSSFSRQMSPRQAMIQGSSFTQNGNDQSSANLLIPRSLTLAQKNDAQSKSQSQTNHLAKKAVQNEVRSQVEKLVEYQRIVERDENLGMPEAQAALEVVNHFNEDMGLIQSNMNTLLQMMDQMSQQNERTQTQVWTLEGKTIDQVERQVVVEKSCSNLLDKLGV